MELYKRHDFIKLFESDKDFEPRSKDISTGDAIKWIESNSDAKLCFKKPIYRGIGIQHNNTGPCYFIQPSKHIRRSANTLNYYTLLVDNSENWSEFPKRSESIICTNNLNVARAYDNQCMVFPKKDVSLGFCIDKDFWWSNPEMIKKISSKYRYSMGNIDDFNTFLDVKIFEDKTPKTYEEMLSFLNKKPEFWELLQSYIKPFNNKVLTLSEYVKTKSTNNEVWTDSDCILVKCPDEQELNLYKDVTKLKKRYPAYYEIKKHFKI